MRIIGVLSIASLLSFVSYVPDALAQAPNFVMKPAAKFSDDTAVLQIIGGTKADSSDWPATFVFLTPRGGGCTSTAVGPRVILTAAHCINHKAVGFVELNARKIALTCYHHPSYRENVSESDPSWHAKVSPDFALCIAKKELSGMDFESIDRDGKELRKGQTIRLVGFGCNQVGGTDGGFGVLYEGDAVAQQLPNAPNYYTRAVGGAAVCFGDSGGGDYILLNPPSRDRRVLMGVTSRGNISKVSLLSTTSVYGFLSWADSFAKSHNTKICGLHGDANGCRPN